MMIVVLVVHVLLAVSLIGVVLIQKSEGGGLGLGGGGGGGMSGFMTGRSTANLLTRTTAILAGCFMATSVLLAILAAHQHSGGGSILDQIPAQSAPATQPAAPAAPAAPAPAQPQQPSVPLAK
ncbi:MAG TPA: preprotein translocase subunit SecG [Aliidongia sp.]|nr:preprotein translocase subunit SecG [Aliidongia sp.]